MADSVNHHRRAPPPPGSQPAPNSPQAYQQPQNYPQQYPQYSQPPQYSQYQQPQYQQPQNQQQPQNYPQQYPQYSQTPQYSQYQQPQYQQQPFAQQHSQLLSNPQPSSPSPQSAPPPVPSRSSTDYQSYQNVKVNTASANLALDKLNKATDIGLATLEELEKQASGIDKIDRDVEKIHLQLDRGDRQLKSISGLTGAALNLVTNDNKAEKQSKVVYSAHNDPKDRALQLQTHHAVTPKLNTNPALSNYDNMPEELRKQMEEQDRQLELLSKGLGNLQNIAGTMGTELDRQNAQIAKINYRVDQATARTHNANYKMGTMM